MNELRQSLSDTWYFFKKHISWICLIVLPVAVPIEIVNVLMEWYVDDETFTSGDWIPFVLEIFLYPIHQGALICYLASTLSGKKYTLKQLYAFAFRYWGRLFLLYLIVGITFGVGFLLLVLPGLIVLSRSAFSEFYCLFDNRPAIESFFKSWNATKDEQWFLLKGGVTIYLITLTPFIVLSYIIAAFELWNPFLAVMEGVTYTVVLTLITIFYFRVFTLDSQRLSNLINRDAVDSASS